MFNKNGLSTLSEPGTELGAHHAGEKQPAWGPHPHGTPSLDLTVAQPKSCFNKIIVTESGTISLRIYTPNTEEYFIYTILSLFLTTLL